jgi:hypothetical protein
MGVGGIGKAKAYSVFKIFDVLSSDLQRVFELLGQFGVQTEPEGGVRGLGHQVHRKTKRDEHRDYQGEHDLYIEPSNHGAPI